MKTKQRSSARSVALVGMGYWGRNLARNFHQLGALAVICDSNKDVGRICQENYPGVRFCQDFTKMLEDPTIKAVVLASPAVMHYEMARSALSVGKDVYVEKPMAIEVAQGNELVKLAHSSGRILMVGHILRYHPAILKLQDLIKDGALGRLQYLYSNRLNIGKIRTEENILWSFAPHDVSVILALLNEMPNCVSARGAAYLNPHVLDVTLSHLTFPSGVQAHIHVSWLHPFKEQRLVVVGSEKMAVFDDMAESKLLIYPHKVEWKNRLPTAVKAQAEVTAISNNEPLKAECEHFLHCISSRTTPITDANEGLRVLRVLDACQRSLVSGGDIALSDSASALDGRSYYAHNSAFVDEGAKVGASTKIWHFSHIMKGASIGEGCTIGQNVNIDRGSVVGNGVKIQNNVSIFTGVVIEDDVFLGPSCVLTNVSNPRSQVNRRSLYERTVLKRGCTIGANATILCGVSVGQYAFVAAGAVVTKDVPDYALVMGSPARRAGWMSRHGHRLKSPDAAGIMTCPESGLRYREVASEILRCLDWPEEKALPANLSAGTKSYEEFKQ